MDTLMLAGFNAYQVMSPSISRVLIVEDDPVWRIIIERSLRLIDPDSRISASASANQALALLTEDNDFDLIIADQILNGSQTGLDLWDTLRRQGSDIPYVLLSGTARGDLYEQLKSYPAEAIPRYLEKPASPTELSQLLANTFLNGRAQGNST